MDSESQEEETATLASLPLASISQQPYVSELLSFTLDRLHKEPELLRLDAKRIQRQMQEVAVGNYRAFISAADALLSIRDEVSSIDKHLELLVCEIPKLTSGCTEFIESVELILNKRKMNQTYPCPLFYNLIVDDCNRRRLIQSSTKTTYIVDDLCIFRR